MFRRGGGRTDRLVCDAEIRDLLKGEARLAAQAASNPNKQRQLAALRMHIAGERAKCIMEHERERKVKDWEARAQRAAHKAERIRHKQDAQQARIATQLQREELKAQRWQLRQQRIEAGDALSTPKLLAAGGVAAGAAAFFLL
jgi:hypothetical protein